MKTHCFMFFVVCLFPVFIHAQVENVIVEKYYVSDSLDATDTIGGGLPKGSITYRVYIDLKPGCKLMKIYGDAKHALKISSTDIFFNNKADGQTFAKDMNKNRLDENTVALDTWLTLGQTTKYAATNTYFGILKTQDTNGSIIGGINNDGGSPNVPGGLMTNAESSAGIPLTTADGLDTMANTNVPINWGDYGIVDFSSGTDSTIFGSIVKDSQFVSNNAALQNTGVRGVVPDSNQVLVAQLTTLGSISFELNIEVEEPDGIDPKIVKYVATGDSLLPDEILCPFLKYPPACGCKDIRYLEYSPSFACSISDSCKTLRVFGCTDPMACNYDPNANSLLQGFCCYPGNCQNRDLSLACPSINDGRYSLYPNPAHDWVTLDISAGDNDECKYAIYDLFGKLVFEKNMGIVSGSVSQQIDISGFNKGIYSIRLYIANVPIMKTFFKN